VHGVAWQRPWLVSGQECRRGLNSFTARARRHWPFAFEVRQRFELDPMALTGAPGVQQPRRHPQPVGLGWHPYFPKRSAAACTSS
jgi:aldose 1-epimerase